MHKVRNLVVVLFVVLGFVVIPAQIASAATFSVVINQLTTPQANICQDDTCDDYISFYSLNPDVSGRGTGSGNEVPVDVCFFGDTDQIFSGATVSAAGTLYSGVYVTNNHYDCGTGVNSTYPGATWSGTGWKCGLIQSDQIHCKISIDDDSNATITVTGRQNAPYECGSDTLGYPPPTHNRFTQVDLYKHSDATKYATDSDTAAVSCLDDNGNDEIVPFLDLWFNVDGGLLTAHFKPQNGIRIYDYWIHQPEDEIAGPITYRTVHTLPSWVTATSCTINNQGSTWYSPLNPPTCVITGSGHTVTIDTKFGADVFVEFQISGNIGSIPECPSASTFTKDLISMDFMERQYDGAWRFSQGWQVPFTCQ